MYDNCETNQCPPSCENVFDMVHVSYLIRGGTHVMWSLLPTFTDPTPWTFQLQVGHGGTPTADDWENVGLPLVNACYAVDPGQILYSVVTLPIYYRVKLTTSVGVYYSDPVAKAGILSVRDWRIAKEIVRKEKLRFKHISQDGYLLKRRVMGSNCPICSDFQTLETTNPYCPQCWGTGKECGYFYPVSCIWADFSPQSQRMNIDDQGMRGTVQDIKLMARMLMLPLISEQDVWVNRKTDDRYFIQAIQHTAEIRGVPLIANVELRPAPFSDVVYKIAIPQQDEWLDSLT